MMNPRRVKHVTRIPDSWNAARVRDHSEYHSPAQPLLATATSPINRARKDRGTGAINLGGSGKV